MKDYLFIVNPKAGRKRKRDVVLTIHNQLKPVHVSYEVIETQHAGHGFEIASENISNYRHIVAVGGDGTVNEVAKALVNQPCSFGIVPLGSGNGLARSLQIPMKTREAIALVLNGNSKLIDTAVINKRFFINVSGIGFDAEIAHVFAKAGKRGGKTYLKSVLKEYRRYKGVDVSICIDNHERYAGKPFLVSIANSTQWGNNAHINPLSQLDDGKLELCLLDQFPRWKTVLMAWRLFSGRLHHSVYFKKMPFENARILVNGTVAGHLDGEPVEFNNELTIKVLHKSLHILI